MPVLILWGMVVILAFGFFWLEDGFGGVLKGYYLLPWAVVAGAIVLAPSVYLFYRGNFDPFHPLVFPAWSYVFPALIVGAFIISFHLVDPYFMVFIDDPEYNLPLSLVYVAVGFLGLTVGYALPVGGYFASIIERRLPDWQWEPSRVWLGGFLLLLFGIGANIIGFMQGIMGFQRVTEIGIFDGLLFFLVVLINEGNILLWLAIFNVKQKSAAFFSVLALLIAFIPFKALLMGSRSNLLGSIFLVAMAFRYSGRRLGLKNSFIFGGLLFGAVCIGVVYGTAFRNIKGSEARMNTGEYVGQIGATFDYLSTEDPMVIFQSSFQSFADRVENLSSLAVVVSNYERLAPYEESYGLKNNIVNDTLTSFVPRFFWNDKPSTSDNRAYSDLYFNYGDNSFAITPFGDLLRNFGPVGVPLGMLVLGIYLRIIYSTLIDTPKPALWKKVAYLPLLVIVSYEGFYAVIFPSIIRTVFVLAISLFIVNLIIKVRVKAN